MARRSIAETEKLALANQDSTRIASVYMVSAEIEYDTKNYDAALQKILISKAIFAQKKKMAKYCEALTILGKIYFEKGDWKKAEQCWQECNALKDYILPYEYAALYSKIGNLQLKKGNLAAAKKAIENSLAKTDLLGYKEIALENQLLLAKIFEKEGDFRSANQAYQKAIWLSDSLAKVNNKRQMTEAQFMFDVEKKDTQIKTQQQALLLKSRLNYVYFIGIILLLTALFFIWRQMKGKQKAQQKAELLLTELNHRVKNNLQTITSIMRLQSRQIKDVELLTIFNESQQRLEAVSILHQQFYKNDNIEYIDLQSFANQLVDKLAFTYNFEAQQWSKNIKIEHNPIHVKYAQPLALIINELVTNSFKHAFLDTENPHIEISLSSSHLTYTDNGCGMPLNYQVGLGIELITALSEQLHGKYQLTSENGLRFEMAYAAN